MATKELAKNPVKEGVKRLSETLQGMMPAIQKAMPKGMLADRLARIALTEVQRNPDILSCSLSSIVRCLLQCAQLGLYTDSVLGHAYLIPYRNNKKHGSPLEAQLIVGYKGYINLAFRSGEVAGITAQVVYENDTFELVYGTEPKLLHTPCLHGDRGAKLGVYMVARMKGQDVDPVIEFLTVGDVERAKKSSKTAGRSDSPWQLHEEEMWRKTAIRKGAKYLPLSSEDARVVDQVENRDDENAGAIEADVIDLSDGGELDVQSLLVEAATAEETKRLTEKYGEKDQRPEPEPPTCCPDAPAGRHLEGCPNAQV